MARTFSFPVRRIGPVLLVDDYDDARASVREALESTGYEVVEAAHGQQALDRLVNRSNERVALVILDLQMPVMDGWKLLEVMNNYVGLSTIPVIVVSSHPRHLEQLRYPNLLASIQAPYEIKDLIDTVDACLADARRPDSATSGIKAKAG